MPDRKWWTLIVVSAASFMLLVDITVVTVALPAIERSLHASLGALQWVIDAYALTLAAFLLTAGVLSDSFGRRKVFLVGLAVFTASSLACALSVSSLTLDLARGAQGVGDAMMFASSLALITNAFEGRDRGMAFGVFGAVTGVAISAGPLIGGFLTSTFGWRWIFFVNVPIGVVTGVLAFAFVGESRRYGTRAVDWPGFVTFSGALFSLVYALLRGPGAGWTTTWVVGLLFGSAILFIAFVMIERPPHGNHRVRRRDHMVELSLFRRSSVGGISAVALTVSSALVSLLLYLTLYMQNDLRLSPLAVGVRLLPFTLPALAVAPLAGRLSMSVATRYLLGSGLLAVSVGLLLMAQVHASSGWTQLVPGFVVAGVGLGTVNPVLASAAVSVVPAERSGMGSGLNSTFWQVGVATGIAVLGAVFQSQIRRSTLAALSATVTGRQVARSISVSLATELPSGSIRQASAGLAAGPRHALETAYRIGFATTLSHLMLIAAGIAAAGSLAAFSFIRQRDLTQPPGGFPAPASTANQAHLDARISRPG